MKYSLGNKFLLNGIECKVVFINARGWAYLAPVEDDLMSDKHLMRGVVFAILNEKGLDSEGHKGSYIVEQECGAV